MSASNPTQKIAVEDIAPLDQTMELRCGACGKVGRYKIGRLMLDPIVLQSGQKDKMDTAFAFSGYIHCKRCQAGGPWELTPMTRLHITALMVEAVAAPDRARIHFLRAVLFDGTVSRWATQAEAYLQQLIEKDPGNYFLWSRLGNTYKSADVPDLAVPAFQKAVELNEHDIESLHSLGDIHLDREEFEKAAEYYHQVLSHARHAPERTRPEMVRGVVEDALRQLSHLHLDSGKRIPLFPTVHPPEPGSYDEKGPKVLLLEFDLSDPADRERLIDWWITGKPPVKSAAPKAKQPVESARPKAKQPPPAPLPRALLGDPVGSPPRKVGRNDRCPCGSARKYKNCCMKG